MLEQRPMAEQPPSRVAVTAFYGTSALVTSVGLAILIAGASIAYAISQAFQ
jgi:hypothetical protein